MALTGEIIVHFKPDWNENRIAEWAKNMDLEIIKSFPFSPNTYLFKAGPNLKSLEIANQIYISGEVIYAYPNWWKAMNTRAIPDDPLFSDQWHLQNTGQGGGTSGEDVNIISVWDSYRGSDNEVIAIVDDGLELLHEDLAPNILSGYSWDYVGNDPDPTAGDHGTSVAGVAAARGWNTLGVTGAAPNTKLVGYRLLGAGTDANEASALNNNLQIVDIYSNSWGPYDDRRLEGPGPLTLAALASGTANGRGSRGNIYVWAGGNGNNVADVNSDNSNYDGYASSRYVMAIAASSNYGRQSGYSEDGANILVNAPSNGGSLGITTTDRTGALGYDNGDYTSTFGGTSSATPLASGIISLMLQANPDLTWRDVRLILAKNAEKNDLSDVDWTTNGAGYHINHKYGFGRIDADVAVSSAANWTNVGPEIAVAAFNSPNLPIPDNNAAGVSDTIDITQEIKIEFVEIYFTAADHTYWGDLEIELTSPSGTKSILAKRHGVASSAQRYDNWTFGSVRHMGESSLGTWQLAVMDKASVDTGTFQEWGLRIYGREDPEPTLMDNDIAVFRNGKWFVDTDGDHVADLSFWYGTIIFRHGKWFADTDGDHMADEGFWYGSADYLPVVGDINQDGKDDTIVSVNGHWFVDTDYDHVADEGFWYGAVGYYPVVGDINQDGKDDTIVSVNGHWFADTDYDHVADEGFWYGIGGDIPLVADMDGDGLDDTAVFRNGKWFVDTDYDHVADLGFWYGIAGDKPVVGDIG
jgi:kexin